jgi:hypothetical protein
MWGFEGAFQERHISPLSFAKSFHISAKSNSVREGVGGELMQNL